jgi:hypothetical protein
MFLTLLLVKEHGYCPMGMQLLKQEQCCDERMHCCFDFSTCPTLKTCLWACLSSL